MVYNQVVDFLLRNGVSVCGSNPLPIVHALNSPQYEDDKKGMKGVHALVRNMTQILLRLNGFA
jgi:prephenate dehydratase